MNIYSIFPGIRNGLYERIDCTPHLQIGICYIMLLYQLPTNEILLRTSANSNTKWTHWIVRALQLSSGGWHINIYQYYINIISTGFNWIQLEFPFPFTYFYLITCCWGSTSRHGSHWPWTSRHWPHSGGAVNVAVYLSHLWDAVGAMGMGKFHEIQSGQAVCTCTPKMDQYGSIQSLQAHSAQLTRKRMLPR